MADGDAGPVAQAGFRAGSAAGPPGNARIRRPAWDGRSGSPGLRRSRSRASCRSMVRRFHAFGDGLQIQAVRHLDDGAHDGRIVRVGGQVADEALVDLELVDVEALEVGQAGVAGAEVVDGQLDAQLLEAPGPWPAPARRSGSGWIRSAPVPAARGPGRMRCQRLHHGLLHVAARNCTAERLTAISSAGRPARCQAMAWRQASLRSPSRRWARSGRCPRPPG